jgi:hypothetical protein
MLCEVPTQSNTDRPMTDKPFKATEEDWRRIESRAKNYSIAEVSRAILELRDRVAALEAAPDRVLVRNQTGEYLRAGTPVQVLPTVPTAPVTSVQEALSVNGVFLGQNGLEGLADADSFWEDRPYGTRLYYDDGSMDYLHRDVLRSAIKLIEQNCATRPTHKPAPTPPPPRPSDDSLWEARLHVYKQGLAAGYEQGLAAGRAEQGTTPEPEPTQAPAGDEEPVKASAVETLRELVEVMHDAFFGNDSELPRRVIQSVNNAHAFLFKLEHGPRLPVTACDGEAQR